jgi:molybdate transport system ATP-binding protein
MENDLNIIDIEKELVSARGPVRLHVKINFRPGELIVVFGDSGAGKTTLLRILAGLTMPDRGYIKMGSKVWLDTQSGINIPAQHRNIGFVFQDYALFPNMTVYENILYAQNRKERPLVDELIDKFGLTEFSSRRPEKLSGGQMQRVALARAFARKPDYLMLDEPLSALDSRTRILLQDEVLRIHEIQKTTTFLVSHDLTEVFRLAQKVLKLENGGISSIGRPDELFIDNHISGKVQITGNVVKIEKFDTFYLLTIVTGMNQIIKVTAFQNDMENLNEGDPIIVFSKAFNPIIMKLEPGK